MGVETQMEWKLGSWLVERGSKNGQTKVEGGKGVAAVAQSRRSQRLVETEVVESSGYELVMELQLVLVQDVG